MTKVRNWRLWRLPPGLLVLVLTVETGTLGALLAALVGARPTLRDAFLVWLLMTLEIVCTSFVHRGPSRRRGTAPLTSDLTSVWVAAGVLLLPAGLAALLTVGVLVHAWYWTRPPRAALHRTVYSGATMVLGCLAARSAVTLVTGGPDPFHCPHHRPEIVLVLLAVVVLATVNSGLVAAALLLSRPRPPLADIVGTPSDHLLEAATLTLGALVATGIAINTWLALLVLPAVYVLHRALLMPALERGARFDAKTGLLNSATWHARAGEELAKHAELPRGVLVVDVDHFKAVNDTYGHLNGDTVLAAVATAVKDAVRSSDLVGRFGGEEFVVLLAPIPGGDNEIRAIGDRIRERVACLRVPALLAGGPGLAREVVITDLRVSVGAALQRPSGDPRGRGGLAELLQLADGGLYAAKRAGRDQVRLGALDPFDGRDRGGNRDRGSGETPISPETGNG